MFKEHPRGLFVLALANMGERFGFYTMVAIFVLYFGTKFGFSDDVTSTIFGSFLALVYFLPLLGGFIADKFLGYGKTVGIGIVVMFAGYLVLAVPGVDGTAGIALACGALLLICLGTSFFKGNLQALVGNMYDDPKYEAKRDNAFSIFYMCINIGAFFAPAATEAISNHVLGKDGFKYNAAIPELTNQMANGTITAENTAKFARFASEQGYTGTDLAAFGQSYIDSLGTSYNYGFGIACISLIISMAIFFGFRKYYKDADKTEAQKAEENKGAKTIELTPRQTKDRIMALVIVFALVLFFWMAFQQNGLTMTWFARDYTQTTATGLSRLWFPLLTLLPLIAVFYGILNIFQARGTRKFWGVAVAGAGAGLAYAAYSRLYPVTDLTPQIFQQFNPFFIIILTPVTVGLFSWLAKRGREPLAPRKIGIGMLIAPLGFLILAVNSIGLPTPDAIKAAGGVSSVLVSPHVLISTYFMLTIAELFLSPIGNSFVSKVAPPKYKGMAQGGWFASTAIGNYLVAVIGYLWGGMQLWILWSILIVCCLLSAIFLFSVMKRLEKTTLEA